MLHLSGLQCGENPQVRQAASAGSVNGLEAARAERPSGGMRTVKMLYLPAGLAASTTAFNTPQLEKKWTRSAESGRMAGWL